jgi:hypothetical protein
MLFACLAALGAIAFVMLRNHPMAQRLASRPWRDGHDVLRLATQHLSDVFVATPSGALLAPNLVELQMNPDDLVSLCDQVNLGVITMSLTEAYGQLIARHGARMAEPGPADVYVAADGTVPPGRYRLRQGHPASAAAPYEPEFAHAAAPQYSEAQYSEAQYSEAQYSEAQYGEAPQPAEAGDWIWRESDPNLTMAHFGGAQHSGLTTVMEEVFTPVPELRLVTGDQVAQTRHSGARAGRGPVELVLPDVPTVSREHARFSFSDDRWRVTNLGLNGLTLNGALVSGESSLTDGDVIRWGSRPDALESRVEIG